MKALKQWCALLASERYDGDEPVDRDAVALLKEDNLGSSNSWSLQALDTLKMWTTSGLYPGAPSINMIPTLEPKVHKLDLRLSFWSPREIGEFGMSPSRTTMSSCRCPPPLARALRQASSMQRLQAW